MVTASLRGVTRTVHEAGPFLQRSYWKCTTIRTIRRRCILLCPFLRTQLCRLLVSRRLALETGNTRVVANPSVASPNFRELPGCLSRAPMIFLPTCRIRRNLLWEPACFVCMPAYYYNSSRQHACMTDTGARLRTQALRRDFKVFSGIFGNHYHALLSRLETRG